MLALMLLFITISSNNSMHAENLAVIKEMDTESIMKHALVNATKNLRERNSERLSNGIRRAFADLETAREAHAAQAQKAIRRARELVGNFNPQALPIPQIDQALVEAENNMLSQETVFGAVSGVVAKQLLRQGSV